MAAAGFGRYASVAFDFGRQEDVVIPRSIAPIEASFQQAGKNLIEAVVQPPTRGELRIVFQQRDEHGNVMRSWPGGPPKGISVGKVLKISAEQRGALLPIEIPYDKVVWSGLSWGTGEILHSAFSSDKPITIRCSSEEKGAVRLEARVYAVEY
jgi:hypothetical protein